MIQHDHVNGDLHSSTFASDHSNTQKLLSQICFKLGSAAFLSSQMKLGQLLLSGGEGEDVIDRLVKDDLCYSCNHSMPIIKPDISMSIEYS